MPVSKVDIAVRELELFLGQHNAQIPNGVKVASEKSPFASNVMNITLTADVDLDGLSTNALDEPGVRLSWRPDRAKAAAGLHFLGFQASEFGLPVRASNASLDFDFFDRHGFVRPHSVFPLIVMSRATNECIMLAPVDSFHDQVLGIVDVEDGCREVHWGWSGDLASVPKGFCATMSIISGSSPRELIRTWGALVRHHAKAKGNVVNTRGRYADVSVAKLSMWTDNGASYWYRTEEGMDLPSTLEATIAHLDEKHVPISSVELDSWFYKHETTRKVAAVGYPNIVPPTGMLRWEPREDVLGKDGIEGLRKRMGNRPLILHSRHISSKSSYLTESSLPGELWWIDDDRAHPTGPGLYKRWMQQASDWGATAYEQDWLVEVWLGIKQLRACPGRVDAWQKRLDDAARERNISLIWCMATPADMAQAVSVQQIVALRSCDDYRYATDPSVLWRWHLTVSCIIRSLGLLPFKDVFMSHTNNSELPDIDGDPNAMLEACLSALSAGPVGIGDRLGKTNCELVRKTCRVDGVLIKPDAPLVALDRSLRNPAGLLWAETNCGSWRYILVVRTGIRSDKDPEHELPMTETLEIGSTALVYDWKTGEAHVADSISASLVIHEWALWVICPLLGAGRTTALIGDPNAFATMGDRRIRVMTAIEREVRSSFDVLGVHGEEVQISFWSETGGVQTSPVTIPSKGWIHCSLNTDSDGVNLKTHE